MTTTRPRGTVAFPMEAKMTKSEAVLYILSTSSGFVGRLINSRNNDEIDRATGDVIAEVLASARDYWEILDVWKLFAEWEDPNRD